MRVRVGSTYRFQPVMMDRYDSRTDALEGDIVRVINLPGAPKANTMGHCYIESVDGTFLGIVLTESLTKPTK